MNILEIPNQYKDFSIPNYPELNNKKNFEGFFYDFFIENNVECEFTYIPIQWTNYLVSNGSGKNIEDLQNSIFGTIDKRQGITRNPEMTVMNRISNASRYVRTRVSGVTDTEKQLMQFAEKAVNEATDSIDRYLATEYAELLRMTSDISSPLLKAVE